MLEGWFEMKKLFVLVAVLVCMAIIFTGCAQAEDGGQSSTEVITHKVLTSSDAEDDEKEPSVDNQENTDNYFDVNDGSAEQQNGEVTTVPYDPSKENLSQGDSTSPVNPSMLTDTELDAAYAVFDNSLFIGDSRTEGLALYSGIPNADFFCAKSMTIDKIVAGNKVKVDGNDMSIYDLLGAKTYRKVYIGMGLNELGWNYIEDFTGRYKELIAIVQEKQPGVPIYIQALLPVTQTKSDEGTIVNNGQIYWYNVHLVDVAAETGAIYVNPDKPLVDENGALLSDSTTDGIHLKPAYCKQWAKYLAEISQ